MFFPRIKKESYKKDIKNEKIKPLFPGYIFVELQNFPVGLKSTIHMEF